jgi:hypothetical protein
MHLHGTRLNRTLFSADPDHFQFPTTHNPHEDKSTFKATFVQETINLLHLHNIDNDYH